MKFLCLCTKFGHLLIIKLGSIHVYGICKKLTYCCLLRVHFQGKVETWTITDDVFTSAAVNFQAYITAGLQTEDRLHISNV